MGAAVAAALVAGVGALLAARVAAAGALWWYRLARRWLRLGLGFARFWWAAGTLQLLRRCPDCKRLIRRDARVCRHCGWRRGAQRS